MADELFDKQYRSTVPNDANDPPRFAQVMETTKDAFVLGLRTFFDETQAAGRRQELPHIDKYAVGFAASQDPFLTTVEIVQEYPDILEQLPHVSVTVAGVRNRRATLGVPLIDQVQYPPRVEATSTGPYDLSQPTTATFQTLRYRTQPNRVGQWVESAVVFRSNRIANLASVSVQDVVRVINEQALYVRAFVTPENTVAIECGGRAGGDCRPNVIEILGTSTATVLTQLGLTPGQLDNSFNATRAPANRYHMAAEVQVNIDVITPDPNLREELADLIYSWATFWLERDFFELQGRTWQAEDVNIPAEWYHVIVHQEVAVGQAQETPRPGDGSDKVHVQRVTVPVTTFQYIDRPVRFVDGSNFILQSSSLVEDENLPGTS